MDLNETPAVELSRMIHSGDLSSRELMAASLRRIERLNPQLNAIPTLLPEKGRAQARIADERQATGEELGPLHGFPFAIKDLVDTEGIRTTYGSPIYRDYIPTTDALLVERIRSAGAIIIGKTNTPEFGAGSQTYNEVFGVTCNPYDPDMTCGGSSGGAAVALATGMVPLADGSDLGGSLRNPASFCNLVGFRPSIGRVPTWPNPFGRFTLAVEGPMARTVRDAAFLLSVLAGPDPRAPLSISERGDVFLEPLARDFRDTVVAWSPDLGRYPVQKQVREICEASLPTFESLGCRLELASPDFSGADEAFQVLRAWGFASTHKDDLAAHRDQIKETVVWNIEKGLELSAVEVAQAEATRVEIYRRALRFLEEHSFLILPVSQVAPFPVEQEWVREIEGQRMGTYVDWMATCYAITLTGFPAISVPCGFTPDGLPVGIQIVGGHRKDFEVLQLAHAFEGATGHYRRRPPMTRIE
jgi:amidase